MNNIHHENPKRKCDKDHEEKKSRCGFAFRFSSQRPPIPERGVIYPNGILPAPPILHLRHLGNFRSPPIRGLCMRHHDNQGHLSITDKPCSCRNFSCTGDTLYVKLLMLCCLRTWWPHWSATEEATRPKSTRSRRGRRCYLFGRNTTDVDGQWLSF